MGNLNCTDCNNCNILLERTSEIFTPKTILNICCNNKENSIKPEPEELPIYQSSKTNIHYNNNSSLSLLTPSINYKNHGSKTPERKKIKLSHNDSVDSGSPRSRKDRYSDDEATIKISNKLFINEQKEKPEKKYIIIKELGKGAYGKVFLAENIFTKEKVAMKKIKKTSEELLSDGEIKDEIEILKNLDHPNIVRIIEFFNKGDSYYIINEYCPDGELFDIITNNKIILKETQIAVIFRQIFSGLAYLHSNNVVHRDLKPENLLIESIENINGQEYYNIKIIDFGTARIFDKKANSYIPQSVVGSIYYIAPEVFKKNYNRECDLWSAGVILYMFIVGKAPFNGRNDLIIKEKIQKGIFSTEDKRWIDSSNEVKDLIKKLLVYEPNKRLTASEALNHPWFTTTNSDILEKNITQEEISYLINNLLNYKITSKFEELVYAYIIHNMPRPKEAKSAIKLFKLANKNKDGKLLRKELKDTLSDYIDELKNFDEIFSLLDGDNNGYIDYEEFLRGSMDRKNFINEEVLKYAFDFFDKEKKGFLSRERIKEYFISSKISERLFETIFNDIDTNGDGKIDFQEFKDLLIY